ncbi:MAG: hypothetical protein LBG15_02395 [Dysgonamonadaceae bacterium]|nr:hypothetical protein [Dysgonamonadaceae bacterium]
MFCFVSCSNEEIKKAENEEVKDYTQAFADLNVQLDSYSQEFLINQPAQLRRWGGFLAFCLRDAIGAAVGGISGGGVVGAVILGAAMSLSTVAESNYISPNLANPPTAILGKEFSAIDSIGYYHNIIIAKLYNKHGDSLFAKDISTLATLVANEVSALRISTTGQSANTFVNSLKSTGQLKELGSIAKYSESLEYTEIINQVQSKFPQLKSELNVIKIYYDNISSLSDNATKEYSTGFNKIVSESEISSSSISAIKSSVSVAVNSQLLWAP